MHSLRHRATWASLSLVIGLSTALLMSVGASEGISGPPELEPLNWLDIAGRNGGVGLLLVAGGLLVGVPTLIILAGNGFLLGGTLGVFLASEGGFTKFLLLTLPHGLVELPALILLGAVGLGIASHVLELLGIRSNPPPPVAGLTREAVVALLMILAAAILEAQLTPPHSQRLPGRARQTSSGSTYHCGGRRSQWSREVHCSRCPSYSTGSTVLRLGSGPPEASSAP